LFADDCFELVQNFLGKNLSVKSFF
jgi:hypothetical protein